MAKPKQPSSPADPAVKNRTRGAFAGDNAQHTRKMLTRSTAQPRGPPDDIEIDDYDADTIPIFCKKHRLSLAFYYKLKNQGKTPREIILGKKKLISREAAKQWRVEREAAALANSAKRHADATV